jgi:hypothetical protein
MKANRLDGKKAAVLVADGFEQGELEEPRAGHFRLDVQLAVNN